MLTTTADEFVDVVAGLDNAGLTEHFRDLELQARRIEAEMAVAIAEGERRQIFADDGHHSMKGWLKANANWSNPQVTVRRRLARLIDSHPAVGVTLGDGHIGVAQANELSRVYSNPRTRDQFGDSVELLLVQAEQLEFVDARICLKRWETFADLDGAHDDREHSKAGRTATVAEVDGALWLKASGGSAEDAAEMEAIFNRAIQHEFEADVAERTRLQGSDAPASMLPRSDSQRRFDALQTIFRDSVAVPADAKYPKPLVNILIDQHSFEQALAQHGLAADPTDLADIDMSLRRSETSAGTVILPDVAVRAALLGHVRRVVLDSAGVVINMGRKQRLFTGNAREAAKLMAYRCDNRGCDVPAEFSEVDHMTEWEDNGPTNTENSGIDCKRHNLFKHLNKITAQRQPNGQIVYHRQDGTPILPVGQRPPSETEDEIYAKAIRKRLAELDNLRPTQHRP